MSKTSLHVTLMEVHINFFKTWRKIYFSVLFLLFPQGNKILQKIFSLFQNRKKSLKMQVLVGKMMLFSEWQEKQNVLEQEKSKQNFSRSRTGKIFPVLEQEKFFLFQNRKIFSCSRTGKVLLTSFPVLERENFFLFQNGKIFPVLEQEKLTGKIVFTFLTTIGKIGKIQKNTLFVNCSNSVLLKPFFIVFNCIFPRFSRFKIDSRNLFHFSACGLEAEKCFSNQC